MSVVAQQAPWLRSEGPKEVRGRNDRLDSKPIDQLKAEQLAACPNQGIVTDGLVIGEGFKEPITGRLILEAELSVAQPDEDVLRADRAVSIDLDVSVRRGADHLRAGDQRSGGFDRSIGVQQAEQPLLTANRCR